MFPQNLHTHTVFGDGKHTAEEMALAAISSGCASLGFSEHSPLAADIDPEGWSMEAEKVSAYRAEVLRLREVYRGQLEIFLGLELDADSPAPTDALDYFISSVHGVWADGVCLAADDSARGFDRSVREHFGGDCFAFVKAYYRRVAEAAGADGAPIVGHFDVITKNNEGGRRFDETDRRYRHAALEALEAVMERDVIFEINTGAISRGYRTVPYPAPFLLKAIREKGGRICITSDCHHKDAVTCGFRDAAALAEACGFREAWVLTKDGFQAVGLSAWPG